MKSKRNVNAADSGFEQEVNFVTKTTNAERQRKFKASMAAKGLVQVSGWIYPHQRADLNELFAVLQQDKELTVGPVRHEASGKLRKLRR